MRTLRFAATATAAILGLVVAVPTDHGRLLMARPRRPKAIGRTRRRRGESPSRARTISISTEKPAYGPGDRIDLEIRLKNMGRTKFNVWRDRQSFIGAYSLRVLLPDGKDAPLTLFAKRRVELLAAQRDLGTMGRALRPGEVDSTRRCLTEWYDITFPGKYTVTAIRMIQPPGKANGELPARVEAVSNKLEITIDESVRWAEAKAKAIEKDRAERDKELLRLYCLRIPRGPWPARLVPDKEVDATLAAYDRAVADLLREAERGPISDTRIYAFYLLGELRARAAVPTLVAAINFEPADASYRKFVRGLHPGWGRYPAQEALVKIGSPAVAPILAALGKEEGAIRRELMVGVLRKVLGKDVAELVLQKALEAAAPAEKARYEQAKALLKAAEPKARDK